MQEWTKEIREVIEEANRFGQERFKAMGMMSQANRIAQRLGIESYSKVEIARAANNLSGCDSSILRYHLLNAWATHSPATLEFEKEWGRLDQEITKHCQSALDAINALLSHPKLSALDSYGPAEAGNPGQGFLEQSYSSLHAELQKRVSSSGNSPVPVPSYACFFHEEQTAHKLIECYLIDQCGISARKAYAGGAFCMAYSGLFSDPNNHFTPGNDDNDPVSQYAATLRKRTDRRKNADNSAG